MRGLAAFQLLRDHSHDFAAGLQHFVREGSHQTSRGASVDQAHAARGELATKRANLGFVGGIRTGARTGVDAKILQVHREESTTAGNGYRANRSPRPCGTEGTRPPARREPRETAEIEREPRRRRAAIPDPRWIP